MVRKEPFGKGYLGPGLSKGRQEPDAGSDQTSHYRWTNLQFENIRVTIRNFSSESRDIAGSEPEVLVLINKGL